MSDDEFEVENDCEWINNKPFQKDLRSLLSREVFCENDANCFTLSEAIDGSGKHYKIVFGVILGSGVGGGLVIDKKIVSGDPEKIKKIYDTWVFSRDTTSSNPNWQLVNILT